MNGKSSVFGVTSECRGRSPPLTGMTLDMLDSQREERAPDNVFTPFAPPINRLPALSLNMADLEEIVENV